MEDRLIRTEMILGREAIEALGKARVAVFGIGGVGGYVCEGLIRAGISHFELIDNDKVSVSNLNRQIIATVNTVGSYKVDVMKQRMLEIDPKADIHVRKCFFLPENSREFSFEDYDYVIDAVDTVTAKLELILCAKGAKVPVISAMGAGNKLDAGRFKVADIYETSVCPLAKVMRRELKRRGVESLKVVYSDEPPVNAQYQNDIVSAESAGKRSVPGSISYAPAIAGLMIAAEVIRDIAINI
ncbi:MAG: tRNA threonylcarbamoyladenosine dehydratase [Lachnospiraceae bacterium]|nr:tRNA threonylcarbamoyladenosine dehydratase [Lachnospiraceae bacterium]